MLAVDIWFASSLLYTQAITLYLKHENPRCYILCLANWFFSLFTMHIYVHIKFITQVIFSMKMPTTPPMFPQPWLPLKIYSFFKKMFSLYILHPLGTCSSFSRGGARRIPCAALACLLVLSFLRSCSDSHIVEVPWVKIPWHFQETESKQKVFWFFGS